MGNCFGGGNPEKQPLLIGGHEKDEGGGIFQEDIEGEAWTDVPKRSCVILPGSTYQCPWDVVLWRMMLFLTATFIMVWSIIEHLHGVDDDDQTHKITNTDVKYWFIYLTHWGLMTETLYFFMALCTLLAAVYAQEPERKRMENPKPWYMSFTFALQSVMLPFSFLICLMYWLLVYKPADGKPAPISVATHGGNFLLMLVDFILGQQPMFFMKIWWPITFAAAYGLFSYIYYANGGVTEDGSSKIYDAMDWSDPRGVATLYGIMLGAIVPLGWCSTACTASCGATAGPLHSRVKRRVHSKTNCGSPAATKES